MMPVSSRLTAALPAASLLAASLLVSACTVTLWGPGPIDPNNPGGGNNGGGSNTGAGTTAKVALADKSFALDGKTEPEAVVDVWAGTYPVAIYATPEDQTGRIGKGTFEVKRDGRMISMSLSDAAGALIRKSAVSLDSTFQTGGYVQVQGFVSQLIVDENAVAHKRMLGQFGTGTFQGPPGQVGGQAGLHGGDIYFFRNNVEYVGKAVPEVFKHLAGTWKGPQEALTHGRPDVTVTISADGKVTVSGKGNLSGTDATVTAQWDGQDDYIAPHPTEAGTYVIQLESQKGGGSQSEGGVLLTVPDLATLKDHPAIKQSHSTLSGMQGNLTVNDPVKQ